MSSVQREFTDLQEAFHCLETSNGTKVDAILERTHRDESTCKKTFPVLEQAARYSGHDEDNDVHCPIEISSGTAKAKQMRSS
jgi:hypothetical protein